MRRALRKAFARGDRGATLLEFAIVAMPLFFLLFAITELGLILATNINLSNSVLSLARQVRLGSVVLPGATVNSSTSTQMDLADFKTNVCANIAFMTAANCQSSLQVDVRVMTSFGAAAPNPISGSTFSTNAFCFYSGTPGSIVSIRTYLLWPVATPILLSALSQIQNVSTASGTSSGSYFVLIADEAFVNEPNGTATNTGNGC